VTVTGILLAAGRAERFGSAKLEVPLPDGPDAGTALGVVACRRLASVLDEVIAVVRAGDDALRLGFEREGARVVVSPRADEGIGASLATGVAAAQASTGYIVALADMPWIEAATIERVAQAVRNGASIVAPVFRGMRGHPVGFSHAHRDALLGLTGDEGARSVIASHGHQLALLDVDDPGVLQDVDTPRDIAR